MLVSYATARKGETVFANISRKALPTIIDKARSEEKWDLGMVIISMVLNDIIIHKKSNKP